MQTASIVLERHTAARIWSRHLIAREGIWNPILALSMRFEQISETTLTRIRSNWGAPTNPMTQTCWQMQNTSVQHVSPNPSCDLERWWCYFHLFRCSRCHKPNAKFNAYIWKLGPCDCNAASLILSTKKTCCMLPQKSGNQTNFNESSIFLIFQNPSNSNSSSIEAMAS